MSNLTNDHGEQARRMLFECEQRTGMNLASCSEPNDLVDRIATALSSRDTEVREVLEGLRNNHGCWCPGSEEYEFEAPFICGPSCHAARALYAKLQPLQSENPPDTLRE